MNWSYGFVVTIVTQWVVSNDVVVLLNSFSDCEVGIKYSHRHVPMDRLSHSTYDAIDTFPVRSTPNERRMYWLYSKSFWAKVGISARKCRRHHTEWPIHFHVRLAHVQCHRRAMCAAAQHSTFVCSSNLPSHLQFCAPIRWEVTNCWETTVAFHCHDSSQSVNRELVRHLCLMEIQFSSFNKLFSA